ncbi:MAG: DUF6164 family protein [Marinomonas colpomeniae]|jgi:hypothetical protein
MATLVFRLKYVPDEEADDIRQLLTDHDIAFYETTAGRWQISMAGIWVKDKTEADKAFALIKVDQTERAKDMIAPSIGQWLIGYIQHARQNPVEALFTLFAVIFVIGLTVAPFMLWF